MLEEEENSSPSSQPSSPSPPSPPSPSPSSSSAVSPSPSPSSSSPSAPTLSLSNGIATEDPEAGVIQTGSGATRQEQPAEQGRKESSSSKFTILSVNEKFIPKFNIHGQVLEIKVIPPGVGFDPVKWLDSAFKEIYNYLTRRCQGKDQVSLSFGSNGFSQGPAEISFQYVRDINYKKLWGIVYKVTQSACQFNLDDTFRVAITHVVMPEGSSRVILTNETIAKRSILTIKNNDNLCLPRAIVAAKIFADRGQIRKGPLHDEWNKVRKEKYQRELAQNLVNFSKVRVPQNGCGFTEIEQFQHYFEREGIALMVFKLSNLGKGKESALYDGNRKLLERGSLVKSTLYILYDEEKHHYDVILNLAAAVGSRGFCVPCNKSYNRPYEHRCSNKCNGCLSSPPCEKKPMKKCESCLRYFFGDDCLNRHRQCGSAETTSKSICETMKICRDCFKFVNLNKDKNHTCGTSFCNVCNCKRENNHMCYMPVLKNKTNSKRVCFVFYDFETQQSTVMKGTETTKIHVPNLCVAHQVCTECILDEDITNRCNHCGVREYIFKRDLKNNQDPVDSFMKFVTRPMKEFNEIICIAHNSRGFDAQFLLAYLVNSEKHKDRVLPSVVLNGTKIMEMRLGKTRFIDSLNYFQMPLSALPKAFGLTGIEEKKGTFPHLFNTPDNENYVGPLPDTSYYSPNSMSRKAREEFLKWYNENKEKEYKFDFKKELVEYCRTDVGILRKACLALRSIFVNLGNVCPFSESMTIASACLRLYRKNFLPPKTIGVIPNGGYRYSSKQSRIALEWILWLERLLGITTVNAARSREFRLPEGDLVDGYYEDPRTGKKVVFQFHGCLWHGCKKCYNVNRDKNSFPEKESLDERYERTRAQSDRLKKYGYELVEIWECEFNKQKRSNSDIERFAKDHPLLVNNVLKPRDAFFGGRTGCTFSFYEITGSERIHYIDVCSLYPYILKTGKFPIGHPKIYIGEEECKQLTGGNPNDLHLVEGIVKCKILPPSNLYHPVLPVRMHDKLMFPLCRTCCEGLLQEECTHEDCQREFEGTWVSDELKKALEKGYKIVDIYEIWQYETLKYDSLNQMGGLFTGYINMFLKIKHESSGWPSWCMDEETKENFLKMCEELEGIKLDPTKIKKNPGLRSVAKLCLNSLWGKFGQRENMRKTEIIDESERFMEMMTNPDIDVNGILPANDDVLYLSWTHKDEVCPVAPLTNVAIAAYTTAQARLKLYEYLEKLDRRVLYYDTDSCIYVSRGEVGEYNPPLGSLLGDMTDELEEYGKGSYIKSFMSGGPKFYAYKVCTPNNEEHSICKVKGITLNYETSEIINFESIRELVTADAPPIELNYSAIRRTALHQVVTRPETKTCKVVYRKRRRIENHDSVPFGYKKVKHSD